jgi:hypothetical protein
MSNNEAKARAWLEFLAKEPAVPFGPTLRAHFDAGRITRLCTGVQIVRDQIAKHTLDATGSRGARGGHGCGLRVGADERWSMRRGRGGPCGQGNGDRDVFVLPVESGPTDYAGSEAILRRSGFKVRASERSRHDFRNGRVISLDAMKDDLKVRQSTNKRL